MLGESVVFESANLFTRMGNSCSHALDRLGRMSLTRTSAGRGQIGELRLGFAVCSSGSGIIPRVPSYLYGRDCLHQKHYLLPTRCFSIFSLELQQIVDTTGQVSALAFISAKDQCMKTVWTLLSLVLLS